MRFQKEAREGTKLRLSTNNKEQRGGGGGESHLTHVVIRGCLITDAITRATCTHARLRASSTSVCPMISSLKLIL